MLDCIFIVLIIIAAVAIWLTVVFYAARSLHAGEKKQRLFLGGIPPAASLSGLALASWLFFLAGWDAGWFFWLCAFMLHALAACGALSLTRLVQKRMGAVPFPKNFAKFLVASSILTLPGVAVITLFLAILPALISGRPL